MTLDHRIANSQWQSGTQPAAIVNWPPIEEEDTMTDGPSLTTPRIIISDSPAVSIPPDVDLTTFAPWLQLQPISTHAGMLEEIAKDLYRRQWPTIAGEVLRAARELSALSRHEKQP